MLPALQDPEPEAAALTRVNPRRVAWPVACWPIADQEAWKRARRRGNPKFASGAAASWRPASRKAAVGIYGRMLAFLGTQGLVRDAAATASINPAAAALYLAYLESSCAPCTVAGYFKLLHMMVRALAPKQDWQWLSTLYANLQKCAEPIRDKRSKIVPILELLRLGLDLMDKADASALSKGLTRFSAQDYRDGLMIALLAHIPLRQINFVQIRIGKHLVQIGNTYCVRFAGAETKSRHALDYVFPENLLTRLDRYTSTYSAIPGGCPPMPWKKPAWEPESRRRPPLGDAIRYTIQRQRPMEGPQEAHH